jgi:hypothetical protein
MAQMLWNCFVISGLEPIRNCRLPGMGAASLNRERFQFFGPLGRFRRPQPVDPAASQLCPRSSRPEKPGWSAGGVSGA